METDPGKQNELEALKGEIEAMYEADQAMRQRSLENNGVVESEEGPFRQKAH